MRSNKPTRPLSGPWKRFQLWRAKRMYARIALLELEANVLLRHANRLVRENSVPPPGPLFAGASSEEEQDDWMRGK